MKSLIKFISICIIFFFIGLVNLKAQDVPIIEKSNKIVSILGKEYYLHKVKAGQTLFSISKVYGVKQPDIELENPELAKGLKTGMEIKIPVIKNANINKFQEKYIYHTVEKKQTLFFLTRKYNVSEQELYRLNPQIKDGLKIGQVLKIPNIKNIENQNKPDNEYYYHTASPGETLFSICQQYGISDEQMIALNPDLNNGLKAGQLLKIPKKKLNSAETLIVNHNQVQPYQNYDYDPNYFEEAGNIPCNDFHYNRFIKFKVALMLPLFIEKNTASLAQNGSYYQNSERFYELYQGVLQALNKLKVNGLSVELYVYDTKERISKTREILNKPELANVDLIIGPVFSENFKIAADFAKNNKINIISPVSIKYADLVNTNPFIFLVNPQNDTKVAKISDFLTHSYDKSIVIIHDGTQEELKLIEAFKNQLVHSFSGYNKINEIVFKQVNYKINGDKGLEDALSVGLDNIIIIPSTDEAFITDVVNKLNFLRNKYKLSVYGMLSWEYFRNIEIAYLANLNFHYGTTTYIDYNNASVKNFVKTYYGSYNTEPGLYSFLGYDLTNYFLSTMKKYGKYFQFCLSSLNDDQYQKGLRYSFNFKRVTPLSGFENQWYSIIKIDKQFNLVRVE